jgi:hypothetical protein
VVADPNQTLEAYHLHLANTPRATRYARAQRRFLLPSNEASPLLWGMRLSLALSVRARAVRRTTANRATRIFITCYSAFAIPWPS